MIRSCALRRICHSMLLHQKAESDSSEHANRRDEGDYMTLANACSIFGYQLSDRFEKDELRKRFNTIVLKYHPDHGGTSEDFHRLLEAYKLLQTVRHDKGEEREVRFHRPHPFQRERSAPTTEDPLGSPTTDDKHFDTMDIGAFVAVALFVLLVMCRHALYSAWDVVRSRGQLREGEMEDEAMLMSHRMDWHPWRSMPVDKDKMEKLAVLRGSATMEDMQRRDEARGVLPASPFSIS